MPKLPERLRALPTDIGSSFKAAGRRASGAGMNVFAQQVLAGFITSELQKLRLDQLRALLADGVFLADIIDEDDLPSRWGKAIGVMSRFMSLRTISDRLGDLITPELVMDAVRRARPNAFSMIINNAGPKWFYDQTLYMGGKIRRIIEARL